MLDRLICPLLVLFGAALAWSTLPIHFGLFTVVLTISASAVSELVSPETEIGYAWPENIVRPWLERPEDEVGGVISVSLASA